jgi:hypothetical protein
MKIYFKCGKCDWFNKTKPIKQHRLKFMIIIFKFHILLNEFTIKSSELLIYWKLNLLF